MPDYFEDMLGSKKKRKPLGADGERNAEMIRQARERQAEFDREQGIDPNAPTHDLLLRIDPKAKPLPNGGMMPLVIRKDAEGNGYDGWGQPLDPTPVNLGNAGRWAPKLAPTGPQFRPNYDGPIDRTPLEDRPKPLPIEEESIDGWESSHEGPNPFQPQTTDPTAAPIESAEDVIRRRKKTDWAFENVIEPTVRETVRTGKNLATVAAAATGAGALAQGARGIGGWLAGVLGAGAVGGPVAAGQRAGPAIEQARPLVAGLIEGEAGGLTGQSAMSGNFGSHADDIRRMELQVENFLANKDFANARTALDKLRAASGWGMGPNRPPQLPSGAMEKLKQKHAEIQSFVRDGLMDPRAAEYATQDLVTQAQKLGSTEGLIAERMWGQRQPNPIEALRPPTTLGMGLGAASGLKMSDLDGYLKKAVGLIPDVKPDALNKLGETTEEFIKHLEPYPGLSKRTMPDDPSMTIARSLINVNAKRQSANTIWGTRGREMVKPNDHLNNYMEYLDHADWAARLEAADPTKPFKLPGDITPQENYSKLHALKQKLGLDDNDIMYVNGQWVPKHSVPGTPENEARQFFDQIHSKTEDARSEMFEVATHTGQLKGGRMVGAQLPDPIPTEHPDPIQVGNGEAFVPQGPARREFQGPIAYQEGAKNRKDYIPHLIDDRAQDRYSIQMMADTEAENRFNKGVPTAGKAGMSGGGGAIKKQGEQHVEGSDRDLMGNSIERLMWKGATVEKRAQMNLFVDRLKPYEIPTDTPGFKFDRETMGAYDKGNGEIAVFPRDIAEGLSEAAEMDSPSKFRAVLGAVSNLAVKGTMKYNPVFHGRQIVDDAMTAFMNAPVRDAGKLKDHIQQHVETLLQEFSKVQNGEFSPTIATYYRRGTMNEVFDSLIQTKDEMRVFSDSLKHGNVPGLAEKSSQVREAAIKSALADLMELEGATSERAVDWANQVTGDYIATSKSGRELAPLTFAMKWYSNAVKRLMFNAIEDPVTAKKNPLAMTGAEFNRAFAHTPWKKLVPMMVAASMWNMAWSGGKDRSFDGLIIPGTDQKAKLPGYTGMISTLGSGEAMLERTNPAFQTAAHAVFGQSTGGKPDTPFTHPMTPTEEAKENARRGGIGIDNPAVDALTPDFLQQIMGKALPRGGNMPPAGQKIIESFAALPRQIRQVTNKDTDDPWWLRVGRTVSPIPFSNWKTEAKIDFARSKDDIVRQWRGGDHKGAAKRWVDGGGDPEELMREITAGSKQKVLFENLTPAQRDLWKKANR